MNIVFWILMILMLLVAIAIMVFPLLKIRQKESLAYKESNLKINEEKVEELDVDLEEGRIDQLYYNAAREELDRELLIDIPVENKESAALHYTAAAKRHPAIAILIALFIPTLVLLVYLDLGMHAAGDEVQLAGQQEAAAKEPSIEEMIVKLEQRIDAEGGTVEEWAMLARAHKYMGDNGLAAKAFAAALEIDVDNAQLMLEQAEVLALNNNRLFKDDSRELVLRAYALEPENPNVLWFAGVSEFQAGNYHLAIKHLTKLLPIAGGEEDVMKSIIAIVQQSRQALIAAGEDMPALEELLGMENIIAEARTEARTAARAENKIVAAEKTAVASPSTSIQVSVDISEQVRQKFDANDTVFVYAKAKQGPRMPLAAQRITLAALPAVIVLDDSMAMVEGMNLSAFDELVISARITKTGSAIAQSGDYIGQADVKAKAADMDLNLVIDSIVP